MSKPSVYVFDTFGAPHAHGPARASQAQAETVARMLTRRLGWETAVGVEAPAPRPPAPGRPSAAQAACSPVWKDAALAAAWEAGKRSPRSAPAPAPSGASAPNMGFEDEAEAAETDRREARRDGGEGDGWDLPAEELDFASRLASLGLVLG